MARGSLLQGGRVSHSTFNLSGTARRRELWLALAIVLLMLVLSLYLPQSEAWSYTRFAKGGLLLALAWTMIVGTKRLHAVERHGAWALLLPVPVLGWLLALPLLLKRGKLRLRSQSGQIAVGISAGLLTILGVLRIFYAPAVIGGEEMKPAFLAGDLVLARYIAPEDIARGDLLLVKGAQGPQVMRVLARGGDRLSLKSGRVWLNGAELPQSPAGLYQEIMGPQGPYRSRPRCQGGPVGEGGLCHKSIWTETLPEGFSYDVLNIEEGAFGDEMAQITIPQDRIFLLGDNRDNSLDSRFATSVGGLGLVSQDQVLGRVSRVLMSSDGARMWYFWAWRYDRFFEAVK